MRSLLIKKIMSTKRKIFYLTRLKVIVGLFFTAQVSAIAIEQRRAQSGLYFLVD